MKYKNIIKGIISLIILFFILLVTNFYVRDSSFIQNIKPNKDRIFNNIYKEKYKKKYDKDDGIKYDENIESENNIKNDSYVN